MKRHTLIIIVLIILYAIGVRAQNITGKVLDAKTTEPLPFANVFLNHTTSGSVSDVNGSFILTNIQPGTYELVVSFVGYEPSKIRINLRQADLTLSAIAMKPSKAVLSNVEVKDTRDKAWDRRLKKFEKIFLGKGKIAASCKILNPWVIDFSTDTTAPKFVATANAPIEILNEGLGYKVFYYLSEFWSKDQQYVINGNVRFEELAATTDDQQLQWIKTREVTYRKSYNFLFKSIITNTIGGAGFKIYFQTKSENAINIGRLNWLPFDTTGIVSSGERSGEFKIGMSGEFEIHHSRSRDINGLENKSDYVRVNGQGFVLNPTDLKVSGRYDENRVASLLPISYQYRDAPVEEGDRPKIDWLYEKIYVHTDKPYYYPGEAMWFKGYINYREPAWHDSLSKVMYVEVINPKKEIALSKTLKIDSGVFYNDFILPDTLTDGIYYLRAYTNLSRNFGDSNLFVKPIPILNITTRIDLPKEKTDEIMDSLFVISADKNIYRARERITLSISVAAKRENFVSSNLSISVTDEFQVAPIEPTISIRQGLSLEKGEVQKPIGAPYPNEQGISFSGQFLNDNSNGEKALLNIMQIKPQRLMQIETDKTGTFLLNDLQFYDSATFAFKAVREKDTAYGSVKIIKRETPPMLFKDQGLNLAIIKTVLPQRTISEYEVPKDARLLEAVVVKGQKIEQIMPYSQNAWSGRIIKGKDLNQTNVLYSLRHIPGVDADPVSGVVSSPGFGGPRRAYSISIDGMEILGPDKGYIGQRLAALNPANIETMHVGRTHIAVFMKSAEGIKITPNFQELKIRGYSSSRSFRHPDYSNLQTDATKADYRSTIYWNPNVVTDAKTGRATVSFFAADLPGKYRIVAEGVTQNGEPVRCVYFVEVNNN